MFTADAIHGRIRQIPFVPLRIVTSAGQSFDIYHPDLVLIGLRELTIGRASTENPAHYDQVTRLAIMHVTALEDLPIAAPPDANGQ
jgi:hypothetical protein